MNCAKCGLRLKKKNTSPIGVVGKGGTLLQLCKKHGKELWNLQHGFKTK